MLNKVIKSKRMLFFLILFINIGISILFLLAKTPFYSTVDDSRMRDIASGAMTGTPDGHLIFIQYPLGAILKWLYIIIPAVPWYPVMMISNIILSLTIVFYSSLSTCKKRSNFIFVSIICFLFYILFFKQLIISPQFTTVASVIGSAAIIWYLHIDFNKNFKSIGLSLLVCVYLCCMSFMYRKFVFFMLIPLMLIVIVLKNFKKRKDIKTLVINLIFVLIIIGSLFAIKKYDDYQYSSQEYTDYRKFNKLRSYINDYYKMPNYEENEKILNDANLSKVQYDVIANYSLMLGDDISIDTLEKIVELQKSRYNNNNLENIKYALTGFLNYYQNYLTFKWAPLFLIVISLYFLYNLLCNKRWYGFLYLGAATCMVIFGSIYFTFTLRFPQRLAEALWIPLTFMIMFVSGRLKLKKTMTIALIALLLLGIYCIYRNDLALAEKHRYEEIESENYIYMVDYSKKNPEDFFYYYVYSFANATDELFPKDENKLLSFSSLGGWLTRSPLQNEKYEKYGFTSTMDALLNHDNVYIAVTKSEDLTFLEEFVNNAYPSYEWTVSKAIKNGEILLLSLEEKNN